MDKTKVFEQTVNQLCKKLRIETPVISQDRRIKKYTASVEKCSCDLNSKPMHCYFLKYSPDNVKGLKKWEIIATVLHELGHIKTDAPTSMEREYKAEKFAHKTIVKYYPQYFERVLGYTEYVSKYGEKIHREAYKKLMKEYCKNGRKAKCQDCNCGD